MPDVITDDINITQIFEAQPDGTIYFPVFYGSTGWWGELLGGDARVVGKLIISPECQLMIIKNEKSEQKSISTVYTTPLP